LLNIIQELGENGYNRTKGGDGGPGITSELASKLNKKRVEDGTHYFLSDIAKKIAAATAKKTNAKAIADGTHIFQNEEFKQKNSKVQQEKVKNGTHYLQSDERLIKMRELNEYKRNRQILQDLYALYKKHGLNATNLFGRNDKWILNRIKELTEVDPLV
jgi:negative regulator of replication initiation